MDDIVVDSFADPPAGGASPPAPPPPPPPPPPPGRRPGASSVFQFSPVSPAAGLPDVLARLEKFAAVLVGLEREVTDLHKAASTLGAGAQEAFPEAKEESERELEALRASAKKLHEENERLEGEL